MHSERTPWNAWLSAALGAGVAPAHFWRLSLKEWRALAAAPGAALLDRSGFEALAACFPDKVK
jgi:uncharacterized phage protein (TIGR02216 family)